MKELRLLFWETTAGCNLSCIHCRRLDVAKEMMKDDLDTNESLKLVDDIVSFAKPAHRFACPPNEFFGRRASAGGPILVLSGGEPLIRPDIFKISRYAVQKGLTVSLATNATLIDNKIANDIINSGIKRVAVSIDGADEKTHDDFRRQPGSLAQALDGFKRLKKLRMSMQINCTITRHNQHQLDNIYKLALNLGADALHLFMLVPVGCGVQIAQTNMLPADEYEQILNWLYDRATENRIHMKATCAPHYMRIARQRAKNQPKADLPMARDGRGFKAAKNGMSAMTIGCLAGSAVCFVSHKGDVFPCGYLPVSCGNVRTKRLSDIWEESPVFTQLRNPDNLLGKCGACEFRKVCLGCRARAYFATGNYMDEEPYCIYCPKDWKMPCDKPWG